MDPQAWAGRLPAWTCCTPLNKALCNQYGCNCSCPVGPRQFRNQASKHPQSMLQWPQLCLPGLFLRHYSADGQSQKLHMSAQDSLFATPSNQAAHAET